MQFILLKIFLNLINSQHLVHVYSVNWHIWIYLCTVYIHKNRIFLVVLTVVYGQSSWKYHLTLNCFHILGLNKIWKEEWLIWFCVSKGKKQNIRANYNDPLRHNPSQLVSVLGTWRMLTGQNCLKDKMRWKPSIHTAGLTVVQGTLVFHTNKFLNLGH